MSIEGSQFQLKLAEDQSNIINFMLTNNPVKNFFTNQSFVPFQNFSSYKTEIPFKGTCRYSQTLTAEIIPSDGDILRKAYFQVTLPALTPTSGTYACYTNTIGFAMIKDITFRIGEDIIIKKYPEELELDWYFAKNADIDYNKNLLVGKYVNLNALKTNATDVKTYTVPLSLPFSDDISTALPSGLLTTQQITIEITLKSFEEVINYDGNTPPNTIDPIKMCLLTEFSTLTDATKQMFNAAQFQGNPWRILNTVSQTSYQTAASKIITSFTGPVKMFYILFRNKTSVQNNDYFNYSNRISGKALVNKLKCSIAGQTVLNWEDESSVRLLTTYEKLYPTNRYIYPICFSEKPLDLSQPSGYFKLDDTREQEFNFLYPDNVNPDTLEIIIIAKTYSMSQIEASTHNIIF